MSITWTSIIKLNTGCRLHTESKRSFHIGYSVVPMGHVRSPDYQKFLGSMDTNFSYPWCSTVSTEALLQYQTQGLRIQWSPICHINFVIVTCSLVQNLYFSHVMFQQKVGSHGFITWNLIMCNNNVTVVMEVLFIWLLPPIMWYIFTCICLTV